MNKRKFIKSALVAGAATLSLPIQPYAAGTQAAGRRKVKRKHWVWINPNPADREEDLQQQYAAYYDAGIRGIFFEADSEKHYRTAKSKKLEAHRWMWIMNRGEKELLQAHPEWYAKNRNGDSCADKPPYVNYYRWLCPSREEVRTYIEEQVNNTLAKDYVDGIHLDYIRYCDVILPVNLWSKYGIEQNRELPEYDFCYCNVCRNNFSALHGMDPLDIQYPDQSLSWRKFRYDNITAVVNRLSAVAHTHKKKITAAVFPTPEVAKRIVRQDWLNWNLDGICPMIYHGFYREKVSWIGDAVAEGVSGLHGRFPLYAGLFLPDFENEEELKQGIQHALANGADGISFFGRVDEKVLALLKSIPA
ncbi:family 10 glycosylhydrolase [Agriterribacter sp.]|uniref:family 10 glycosylhydrolase n=1 Tax=Agriterribacter sp. TaxID=2821509 RepID=UPI002C5A858D|nr:family 10 glycosylhydrolase [Agriterribacter sp.]HRO44433.1 family 10 glycosylhydrolase [Agriterribacter sp.]HRQ19220.1 family 10 glycosylhydrolase [Agriterribacter sp.]